MPLIATVSVSLADSWRFAELSGDFNPLHLDPAVARRLVFGGTVPHGVHLLMLGLDAALRNSPGQCRLRGLRATFAMPGRHGVPLDIRAEETGPGKVSLRLQQNGATLQLIAAELEGCATPPDRGELEPTRFTYEPPRPLSLEEAASLRGTLSLRLEPGLLGALFPTLADTLSGPPLALLLATSRIVGMKCPGLHSIFTGLELGFGEPIGSTLSLIHI